MNRRSNFDGPKVLDLFCGCGGLSKGFMDAGFHVEIGIDNDATALKTFLHNHPNSKAFQENLATINVKNFIKNNKVKSIDMIIGGPPCQGFSISGKRDIDDPRNGFYRPFFEFVNELKPKVFLLENVPNLISMGDGKYKTTILELFESIGYSVKYKILLASEFGVPQNRKRVFFVGVKGKSNKFEFPVGNFGLKKQIISTWDAISDLPELSLEDGNPHVYKPQSKFQKLMRSSSKFIYNHQTTNHSEQTIKIISMVPDGGNYKNLPLKFQDTRRVNIAWTRYSSDKPSFTIDTGHRHHFHYKFNRIPTVRENARLQSFSDDFVFLGSKTHQYKQVGNAVPPLLAYEIAQSIRDQLV